jgi:hypothetical protein
MAAPLRDRLAAARLCVLMDGGRDAASFTRLLESLVEAGVGMIQIRDKALPVPLLVGRVRAALEIVRRSGAATLPLIVVNDRVDVAAALAADGAHVGADDLPVSLTRRVVGVGPLVGRTAHDVAEARAAVADGASAPNSPRVKARTPHGASGASPANWMSLRYRSSSLPGAASDHRRATRDAPCAVAPRGAPTATSTSATSASASGPARNCCARPPSLRDA